jgi:hypothetical protein
MKRYRLAAAAGNCLLQALDGMNSDRRTDRDVHPGSLRCERQNLPIKHKKAFRIVWSKCELTPDWQVCVRIAY